MKELFSDGGPGSVPSEDIQQLQRSLANMTTESLLCVQTTEVSTKEIIMGTEHEQLFEKDKREKYIKVIETFKENAAKAVVNIKDHLRSV
ncbi:unnamed protein product [Thlaspi arvense]|uniref:Uncharacterized protein n=1 Tax=Thlaspi arvense TaxID=13288 RepID=A0AAU9SDH9_THLAR|nr:unnamed protein product [Thlaspi arvense]